MAQEPRKKDQPDRLSKLQSEVGVLSHQVRRMELSGGHVDSKTLSKRCMRIEKRLEKLELAIERAEIKLMATFNSMALICASITDHLVDRHQVNVVSDLAGDIHSVRQIRRLMGVAADQLAALEKRTAP